LSLYFRRNLSKFCIVEFCVEAGEEQGREEEYQPTSETHGGNSDVSLYRSSIYRWQWVIISNGASGVRQWNSQRAAIVHGVEQKAQAAGFRVIAGGRL